MEQQIPVMTPAPGERLQRFIGDRVRFVLKTAGSARPRGWRARLRTNLGRADVLRREVIEAHTRSLPLAGASWTDLPMKEEADGWSLELPLTEVGYFKAKAYCLDALDWQHWPEGADVGISVHPDAYRTANTIYCAFPRLFGSKKGEADSQFETTENQFRALDDQGCTVIPSSGKLRDLIQQLPHIMDTLGCRILHLLPINPTPTTCAKFGRFGSPYAAQDLTAIDPALVVFDKRTTGVDQFRELTFATHQRGGRVFLDIVINHTGWGSTLQENHPEWFLRNPDGTFASPGAWGTTWEDLVEIKHESIALWDELAGMLMTWCRRGVDGFRCDAGYKVPVEAWQYIIARVRQEFPEAIFLLEGLGGALETTEALLTEGGMQWAYSELFQNYSASQVAGYLDYSSRQSQRIGLYVHYSETHDNDRLAKRGRVWSLLRNRLCALSSVSGSFGFTCGVEWLAAEKIRVHGCTGLAWGAGENLVPELARLNQLLAGHPCFFDAANLKRLSPVESPVYALLRQSVEGLDSLLVLVNNDTEKENAVSLSAKNLGETGVPLIDLLGQTPPESKTSKAGEVLFTLPPGAAYCLSSCAEPHGLNGDAYRRARSQAAWAMQALSVELPIANIGPCDWRILAGMVDSSPSRFLVAIRNLDPEIARTDLNAALKAALAGDSYLNVVCWSLNDRRRVTPVPPGHWLLIEDSNPFRATLSPTDGSIPQAVESVPVGKGHCARFAPRKSLSEARLSIERYAGSDQTVEAAVRFLGPDPMPCGTQSTALVESSLVLLTNGRGGMARLCADLGRIQSKYDCALGANLHPDLPVDRHIFAKRIRAWVNADGFISPLNLQNLSAFDPGPPAVWQFTANAGDGRTVEIALQAGMIQGRNTTVFQFSRPGAATAKGKQLPAEANVRLTIRVDIEDRNFHWETKRNSGADFHFSSNTHELKGRAGFAFTPANDRQMRVFADSGQYHPQPEWCENIPHPVEQSRGQNGSGDAYSPGWFDLPLAKGGSATLVLTADPTDPAAGDLETKNQKPIIERTDDPFETSLRIAASAYVAKRGPGKTVIAGYPWFLDWGRDTFIAARGLLTAGFAQDVKQIVLTFARFEANGTLPNTIHGEDASNRDTSDAPLWFGVVCEELAALEGKSKQPLMDLYNTPVGDKNRTILNVLQSIASNYLKGTPNGIRMDPDSALIWSPSHFTWMDTNFPAGTPREGFPVEIQALWIRLLRELEENGDPAERERWGNLAAQAMNSVEKYFWLPERGYYSDLLIASRDQQAGKAIPSDALRSNCLFLVSLGLIKGGRARRCVEAARRQLVVPGALRTLAPLPVSVPLPVQGNNGGVINDPLFPYWSRYEGDEDTRRKPAYHNGTAWTWTFPVFCEALAKAWDFSPAAVAAARAYLGSMDRIFNENCLGQIPEILDGDAPHAQRGCDAQAWGVTEALRVWRLL